MLIGLFKHYPHLHTWQKQYMIKILNIFFIFLASGNHEICAIFLCTLNVYGGLYVCVFQRYTYNLSIQFGNADRKIKLYNAASPLPRRQLSDPTGNSCWFFAPNDYWLCQHPYHLLHCYCILGFFFPRV